MKFRDFQHEREVLKVMTMEYRIERDGHRLPEPIVQLFCRDKHGVRRDIEVEGFYPFFYISEATFFNEQNELLKDSAIRSIEAREILVEDENMMDETITKVEEPSSTTLHGDNLTKVVTMEPKHVSELREAFEETWEADVFFTNRFLIETGIRRGLTIPAGEDRVHVTDIEATEDLPDIAPRMVTIDIEVWSGGAFPDTEQAEKRRVSRTGSCPMVWTATISRFTPSRMKQRCWVLRTSGLQRRTRTC
jgi:DNA polymerase I